MTEPFAGLFTQGMVTHETYQSANGKWLAPEEVETRDGNCVTRDGGEPVLVGSPRAMSKSKRNGVDPEPIVDRYGADAVRWFMLSDSPPERDLAWNEDGIEGASRFIQRLWKLVGANDIPATGEDIGLRKLAHRTTDWIASDIEELQFNKAVARLYTLVAVIEKASPSADLDAAVLTSLRLVAPMIPHLAEEAWARLGGDGLIADTAWPEVDPAMLVDDEVTIAVQVNGKLRDTLTLAKGMPREDVEAAALASDKVVRILDGKPPRKVIVVPDRLVNLVA